MSELRIKQVEQNCNQAVSNIYWQLVKESSKKNASVAYSMGPTMLADNIIKLNMILFIYTNLINKKIKQLYDRTQEYIVETYIRKECVVVDITYNELSKRIIAKFGTLPIENLLDQGHINQTEYELCKNKEYSKKGNNIILFLKLGAEILTSGKEDAYVKSKQKTYKTVLTRKDCYSRSKQLMFEVWAEIRS